MIELTQGNLLEADVEALVNTVNLEGTMGKGIALQFARAFPEIVAPYEAACGSGAIAPGKLQAIERPGLVNPKFILNFPTKRHWRGKSRLADIDSGLLDLVRIVRERGIRSIAVPPLGCGFGGLNWNDVRPRIERALESLSDVRVLLFEPAGAPAAAAQPVRSARPALTAARARVIEVLSAYLSLGYELTLLEVQKLLYLLQSGGEPLKLRYTKHHYGPYADNLRKVLERFEGHFTRGLAEGRTRPDTPIELLPGASEAAALFLASAPGENDNDRLARVVRLIEGYESPYGMELLTTVHWVASNDQPPARTVDEAVAAIHAWNDRKRQLMPREHIAQAWDRLVAQGWITPPPAAVGAALAATAPSASPPPPAPASTRRDYDNLTKDELIRILQRRDAERQFGLVWERDELEADRALNEDFIALDLDPKLSHGQAPYRNLIIEGDNYDALRHLRMTHKGRIKCIYIDPPYNTGNKDFVYNDRFVDKTHRYRHSLWLEFMYRRLTLARELLADDGVILVSIDENEYSSLQLLLVRVFGESNRLGTIVWHNATDNNPSRICTEHEYVVCFGRDIASVPAVWQASTAFAQNAILQKESELLAVHASDTDRTKSYKAWFKEHKQSLWPMQEYDQIDAIGVFTGSRKVHNPGREGYRYFVPHPVTGKNCKQPLNGYRFPESTYLDLKSKGRIIYGKDESKIIEIKIYASEFRNKLPSVIQMDGRKGPNELDDVFADLKKRPFNNPKPSELLHELFAFTVDKSATVLDFFAGSGTTAHSVLKLNREDGGTRRVIMISNTEATDEQPDKNLCRDVCAERVRRVMTGYTNAKGEGVVGLGGNFAYLRTQRIPPHRLSRRLGHAQVWHALQLLHDVDLSPYADAPLCVRVQPELALAYLPEFDSASEAALRGWLERIDAAQAVIYSWAPERVRTLAPAASWRPIPESLRVLFGAG